MRLRRRKWALNDRSAGVEGGEMLKEWFAKAESRGAVGFAEVIVGGSGISRQATCASILRFGCVESGRSALTPCFCSSKLRTSCATRMGSTWGGLR